MTPPNDTDTDEPAWAKNNGKTISATNNNDDKEKRVKTISWPRNATPKHELNPDQIEVIEKAVLNPNITNIAKLNRENCSYEKNRSDTYANQVLGAHWPERLDTNFDTTDIETVDSNKETSDDVEDGIGGISLIGEENTDEDNTTNNETNEPAHNDEWPDAIETPKNELKDEHIAVIEAAIANPDIASTGKLTKKAGLTDEYNQYYAYDVLDSHWRERLDKILAKDNDEKYNPVNESDSPDDSETETTENETVSSETTEKPESTNNSSEDEYWPTSTGPNTRSEPTQHSESNPAVWKIMGAFIAGFLFAYRLLKQDNDN